MKTIRIAAIEKSAFDRDYSPEQVSWATRQIAGKTLQPCFAQDVPDPAKTVSYTDVRIYSTHRISPEQAQWLYGFGHVLLAHMYLDVPAEFLEPDFRDADQYFSAWVEDHHFYDELKAGGKLFFDKPPFG